MLLFNQSSFIYKWIVKYDIIFHCSVEKKVLQKNVMSCLNGANHIYIWMEWKNNFKIKCFSMLTICIFNVYFNIDKIMGGKITSCHWNIDNVIYLTVLSLLSSPHSVKRMLGSKVKLNVKKKYVIKMVNTKKNMRKEIDFFISQFTCLSNNGRSENVKLKLKLKFIPHFFHNFRISDLKNS